MKKNRLLAVGLAALMAVTAVTGCGGSAGTPAGEGDGGSSDGAKETITLRAIQNPTRGLRHWRIIL